MNTSLCNAPNRDKSLLHPYHDKVQFINAFPEIITERSSDYNLYFSTFTFTNLKSSQPYPYYDEFFRYFRQRLDTALLSNSRSSAKAPLLFLFPEQNPKTHFHGIIFLHKHTSHKFQNKCVLSIESEYNEKLATDVSSIRLQQKFINPYPRAIADKAAQSKIIEAKRFKERTAFQKKMLHCDNKILKVADYRIYPLPSAELQMRSFQYSVKNFVSSRFTLDDIIIESKEQTQEMYK